MNRNNVRESLVAGRNTPAGSHHRRGRSLTLTAGISNNSSVNRDATAAEENSLDLFSKNRRSLSVTSSDESSDGTFFDPELPFSVVLNCMCMVSFFKDEEEDGGNLVIGAYVLVLGRFSLSLSVYLNYSATRRSSLLSEPLFQMTKADVVLLFKPRSKQCV